MPEVSVCIPAFNQPELLRRALTSVLSQDFPDYEVVITDDSTDDRVERVVESYSGHPSIRYCRNQPPLGTPRNWNRAAELAEGRYIKWLHHDDWFTHSGSLTRFVRLVDGGREQVGFSATEVHAPGGTRLFVPNVKRLKRGTESLLTRNPVGSPSAVIHWNDQSLRFDDALKWMVDVEFYIRLLKRCEAFAVDYDPLVAVTDGAAHQVTAAVLTDPGLQVYEWLYLWEQHGPLIPNRTQVRFLRRLLRRLGVRNPSELADERLSLRSRLIVRAVGARL